MAAQTSETGFGQVSRIKSVVFEYLSLAASVVGIATLAVLLIYVTIDAFDLGAASNAWVLTYLFTLVAPLIAFLLYSARDPALTRRVVSSLVGGMAAAFVVVRALSLVSIEVGRLSWPLVYLFVVVIPTIAYVGYIAVQYPAGAVAASLLGRFIGGLAGAAGLLVAFALVDVYLWFLAFTLGIAPAVVTFLIGRLRRWSGTILAAVMIGLVGLSAAVVLRDYLLVYPTTWLIYVWTFAVPAGLIVVHRRRQQFGIRRAALGGVLALAGTVGGSLAASTMGFPRGGSLLVLIAAGIPSALYLEHILRTKRGRTGLLVPLLLIGGAILGMVIVELWGFTGPDPWLDWSYLTSAPSRTAAEAGLYPAIVGSIFVIGLVALLSFALGVGTAIFLEDYTPDSGPMGAVTRLIQINIANLAGVPSVVYGLLGLGLFVNLLGLGFGTIIVAAITLSLLILPITIIAAQEAIRSVPDDLRNASYGMGATRWQTTKNVVLPEALPGILTGTILALGRAIGETAPLIMIGAPTTVFDPPTSFFSRVSAMPMQIYAWSDFPQEEFRYGVVAAGVITLLAVLLSMNATAILIRNRYQRAET